MERGLYQTISIETSEDSMNSFITTGRASTRSLVLYQYPFVLNKRSDARLLKNDAAHAESHASFFAYNPTATPASTSPVPPFVIPAFPPEMVTQLSGEQIISDSPFSTIVQLYFFAC